MAQKDITQMQKMIMSISSQIIEEIQTTLFMKCRFMNMAVGRLKPVMDEMIFTAATDADKFYYAGKHIIKLYQEDKNALLRLYLHSVLHCVFLHPFVSEDIDKKRWNFACDIAVENVISELGIEELFTENVRFQKSFIAHMNLAP